MLHGDISVPSHTHGLRMPGFADLAVAKPRWISIGHKDVEEGGVIV